MSLQHAPTAAAPAGQQSKQTLLSEDLGDSWIEMDVNSDKSGPNSGLNSRARSPDRVTPLPFSSGGGEEYLRLLREAQRDSKESSRVASRRDSPRSSPKSPPNSPNNELSTNDDLKGIFINYYSSIKDADGHGKAGASTTAWDWDSRIECPPKEWKLPQSPTGNGYSLRLTKVGKNSLFSKEVLYSLLITNMLSLIIGTGVGIWLTKRGIIFARVTLE